MSTRRIRIRVPVLSGLLCLGLLGACRSVYETPVPEPLPEMLEWSSGNQPAVQLGVQGEEVSSGSLDALSFEEGVRVARVADASPASRAGLRPGDVILAAGGTPVGDPGALDALLARLGAAQPVLLQVRRGDAVFEVPVELTLATDIPAARLAYVVDPVRTRAGYLGVPGGVRLVTAVDGSPLLEADIPVGSLLVTLDGEDLLSERQLVRSLLARPPGAEVRLGVRQPDGSVAEHEVELFEPPRRVTGFDLPLLVDYTASPDGNKKKLSILDLWIFELVQYERDGPERRWALFELFGYEIISWSTGVGELGS